MKCKIDKNVYQDGINLLKGQQDNSFANLHVSKIRVITLSVGIWTKAMSSSLKNHTSRPQDQTTPQTLHTVESRFPPTYTPPPSPQFSPTPELGGSIQSTCTLMTHNQDLDLKNEYRTMMEEPRRYNEPEPHNKGRLPWGNTH